ncbi:2OG-Fe(II) oxygenase [Phenylobacterium sp.]|uniref:2OG-Fe(II) oxygenase n=1 Tax=Phenylobacterium sp. TaxID=1871053 RepID=UPI002DE854DC|nr:2OG-Fe(II) oxygenase [Phenylobacterium sp.]
MPLVPGEAAPWFKAPTPSNPEYHFDTVAGRYVLLVFLPIEDEARGAALKALAAHQGLFDDLRASAFVVVRDPETAATARDIRGLRWFLDAEGAVSRLYGALAEDGTEEFFWLVLDPTLRVLGAKPIEEAQAIFRYLAALPAPEAHTGAAPAAPVLIAPRLFEPELCRRLIELHEAQGSEFTGVMRDRGEVTVAVMDDLKRRRDLVIDDPQLQDAIRERLERRLFPLIARAFAFEVTRIERYLVSCYDATDGGVFHPHRDNVTFQTAHRKFACSINLNDDFEGGDLRFPEFGPQSYRPPLGGAVVFSCALLHEALRVTQGRRYAFLPFFTDEAGAAVRAAYDARVAARADPE